MTLLSCEAQTELSSLDVFPSQVKSRGGNALAQTFSCVFASAALPYVQLTFLTIKLIGKAHVQLLVPQHPRSVLQR